MLTLPKRIIQVLRPFEEVKSRTHLGLGQSAPDRSDPGARRTHGCCHLAGYGMFGRQAISELSPRPQSRHVVESGTEPPVAAVAGSPVCSRKRATDHGYG